MFNIFIYAWSTWGQVSLTNAKPIIDAYENNTKGTICQ